MIQERAPQGKRPLERLGLTWEYRKEDVEKMRPRID